MASAMSSTFTAADRRKRIATYGKSSRIVPSFNWGDDAPSPERTHKHSVVNSTALKKPSGLPSRNNLPKTAQPSIPSSSAAQDVFDVPDDDDEIPAPAPTRPAKIIAKSIPTPTTDEFDVPFSDDEALLPQRKRGKTPVSPRKTELPRKPIGGLKKVQKPDNSVTLPSDSSQPPRRRAKTPQLLRKPSDTAQDEPLPAKKSTTNSRVTSRRTTPAPPAVPTQKSKENTALVQPRKAPVKAPSDLDVFDVPSEEEEARPMTPRRPRPKALPRKEPIVAAPSNTSTSQNPQNESDDSNPEKKRKRQPTVEGGAGKVGTLGKKSSAASLVREKKLQKKGDDISSRQRVDKPSSSLRVPPQESKASTLAKPKRTRTQNSTTSTKSTFSKTQSSPAMLHNMLAVRPAPTPNTPPAMPTAASFEEEVTMYDIPEATPIARAKFSSSMGSVTPKQAQTLNSLVDDTEDDPTPMPSIRRLQLTDSKPKSLLGGLVRSSSDIPQSEHSRKPRLIDTLRQAAQSSEEEDSEGEDDSEEDDVDQDSGPSRSSSQSRLGGNTPTADVYDSMDIDHEPAGNSQLSQTSVHLNNSSKVTYAKQRSYREEANLEDNLLLSMDLDEPLGFGANKASGLTSDEEEDAGQVRGIHELRRKGQNQKFLHEAEAAIEDISGASKLGNSTRRSAMLELSTRMADPTFMEQMLDSGLGQRFIKHINSNGEIVFDFAAAVAISLILNHNLGSALLDDIHQSTATETLTKLLNRDADIRVISKERKTGLSRIGQESVQNFRQVVQESSIWLTDAPDKISPQIVAMRTLELLVLSLRKAGNTEALLNETIIGKLLDIAEGPSQALQSGNGTAQDTIICNMAFSIMESVSLSKDKQATWSSKVLQRLVTLIPAFFDATTGSPIKLSIRLCMNLTNNKPKACEVFAGPEFVRPLVKSISDRFTSLTQDATEEHRLEIVEGLILGLGAMINLAEFSDQARKSVLEGGDDLINTLTTLFLEGSERAAQADSLQATHTNVTIGYLTVLLGNLCLNPTVRRKVQFHLPNQRIDYLVERIREFVRYNEKVDRETAGEFEGNEEGRETWRVFTRRLMGVVGKLEGGE